MGSVTTVDAAAGARRRGEAMQPAGRPWPVPARRAVMRMRWHDLLFAHWRVDAAALRELIPPGLALDTLDGEAYIGVIPFHMTGIRLVGLPPVPGTTAFTELNVRTYVTDGERAGVYFLTLDATSRLAIASARVWFGLNYRRARMRCRREGEWIDFASRRGDGRAEFVARYRPTGEAFASREGTPEHFFTHRYCLYAWRRGSLVRAEIDHEPWALRPAEVEIARNTMAAGLGLMAKGRPSVVYAEGVESLVWAPERIERRPRP